MPDEQFIHPRPAGDAEVVVPKRNLDRDVAVREDAHLDPRTLVDLEPVGARTRAIAVDDEVDIAQVCVDETAEVPPRQGDADGSIALGHERTSSEASISPRMFAAHPQAPACRRASPRAGRSALR